MSFGGSRAEMRKGGKTEEENRICEDQTKTNKNRIHAECPLCFWSFKGAKRHDDLGQHRLVKR
jgi:hypothetical protein